MTANAHEVGGLYKYQMKLLPFPGILLCLLLLILLPAFVSFRFLDFSQIAGIGEVVMPMLGIFLFTPLAFREDHVGRKEALGCRPISYACSFGMRLVVVFGISAVSAWMFVWVAQRQAYPFTKSEMWLGLWTTQIFFGSIGLTIGHLCKNQTLAYLMPFACFLIEYFTMGRYTGRFFSLSLIRGELFSEKWILLGLSIALLCINIPLSMRQISLDRKT